MPGFAPGASSRQSVEIPYKDRMTSRALIEKFNEKQRITVMARDLLYSITRTGSLAGNYSSRLF